MFVRWKPAQLYSKFELFELIERLKSGDYDAIDECIAFMVAESCGVWHGRARAKICRNLRNRPPDAISRTKLIDVIVHRLETGNFSQNFKDQLKMAVRFDPARMRNVAIQLSDAPKDYVRRYAWWIRNVPDLKRFAGEI